MKKIYLAAPYSHRMELIRQYRFEQINIKAAQLMIAGNIVFSPISHSHPIAVQCDLPLHAEFWQVMNESFIDWADVVMVYCMAGWQWSKGIQNEIEYAKRTGKPVEYID